ncbi:hypothetical protein P154DRAFT_128780 [Amniculicola lignicola CBS 123094]|uniref:Uncharacterized protein n=1 Tax=Amniculicola lignicola CBS 123094 TaxID=1392246 RepID=A0A6A5W116_9PLEO|nr:hypothetical protein P154DRAFT_128780 [Amniculicola lignicola CBS 123094]
MLVKRGTLSCSQRLPCKEVLVMKPADSSRSEYVPRRIVSRKPEVDEIAHTTQVNMSFLSKTNFALIYWSSTALARHFWAILSITPFTCCRTCQSSPTLPSRLNGRSITTVHAPAPLPGRPPHFSAEYGKGCHHFLGITENTRIGGLSDLKQG